MIEAAILGVLAGVAAGLLGVGGGVLFVPALVIFLDQSQLSAEATSLVAIIPVALLGAYRQHRYGNVNLRGAGFLAVFAPAGAVLGVVIANWLPERALAAAFGVLLVFVAYRLARTSLQADPGRPAVSP